MLEQALDALLLMDMTGWGRRKELAQEALRAALEQPQPDTGIPASVPPGWKLVPVNPTEEMLDAYYVALLAGKAIRGRLDIYRAMLAAAPQPPVVEQEPVYAFRRRGQESFCTCDFERYKELSSKPDIFEVAVLYAHQQPERHPLTDEQIDAALKAWFETEKPFTERMRAAFAAAHVVGGEA